MESYDEIILPNFFYLDLSRKNIFAVPVTPCHIQIISLDDQKGRTSVRPTMLLDDANLPSGFSDHPEGMIDLAGFMR